MATSLGRRIRLCGVLPVAAIVALALTGTATAAAPHPTGLDTATATGNNLIVDDFSSTDIVIDAHSGPSGENPGGTVSFVAGGILPISGPVSCLDVTGNTAVLTVDGPFPSAPGFTAFLVRLVDNGGAGRDVFEFFPDDPEVPDALDCHVGSPDYFGGLLVGRATVHDAEPPPTTRQQCLQGGFLSFGFPNLGRCIGYVMSNSR